MLAGLYYRKGPGAQANHSSAPTTTTAAGGEGTPPNQRSYRYTVPTREDEEDVSRLYVTSKDIFGEKGHFSRPSMPSSTASTPAAIPKKSVRSSVEGPRDESRIEYVSSFDLPSPPQQNDRVPTVKILAYSSEEALANSNAVRLALHEATGESTIPTLPLPKRYLVERRRVFLDALFPPMDISFSHSPRLTRVEAANAFSETELMTGALPSALNSLLDSL